MLQNKMMQKPAGMNGSALRRSRVALRVTCNSNNTNAGAFTNFVNSMKTSSGDIVLPRSEEARKYFRTVSDCCRCPEHFNLSRLSVSW